MGQLYQLSRETQGSLWGPKQKTGPAATLSQSPGPWGSPLVTLPRSIPYPDLSSPAVSPSSPDWIPHYHDASVGMHNTACLTFSLKTEMGCQSVNSTQFSTLAGGRRKRNFQNQPCRGAKDEHITSVTDSARTARSAGQPHQKGLHANACSTGKNRTSQQSKVN